MKQKMTLTYDGFTTISLTYPTDEAIPIEFFYWYSDVYEHWKLNIYAGNYRIYKKTHLTFKEVVEELNLQLEILNKRRLTIEKVIEKDSPLKLILRTKRKEVLK